MHEHGPGRREDSWDGLARALAQDMPRRRALRLFATGVAVTSFPWLFPNRSAAAASTCGTANQTPCGSGKVPCCVDEASGGYRVPVGGRCIDAAREQCCTGPDPAGGTTIWTCDAVLETCNSGASHPLCLCKFVTCGSTCCAGNEKCVDGRCERCPPIHQCGDSCCKNGEYCEKHSLGADFCEKICPSGHDKCVGVCCTKNEECGFFGCGCKSGFVSAGTGNCVPPREDPGDPKPGWNPFRDMWNTMGQSSAAHGGGRSVSARSAQPGSAAIDVALETLAAVNGQGAAAMFAIRYGKRDPAFKQKVTVARATPPTLSADAGLDASSVAALNKLLVAEARAHALIAAMAKALWRARAAHAKQNRAAARSQLRASAAFAGQAATALKPIQALRKAAADTLTAGGVSEVLASDAAVTAFIASVKSRGIPATLRTPMSKLGVGSADLERLRTRVRDQSAAAAVGPVLIAPLKNPARAGELKSLISELSKFSARARKHPIAR